MESNQEGGESEVEDKIIGTSMRGDFLELWGLFWKNIPISFYQTGIIVLIVWSVASVQKYGLRKGSILGASFLMIEYIVLIYCSAVFFRTVRPEVYYDYTPFWSYRDYFKGLDDSLLAENIMNVVVFVPVGLLMGAASRSMTWKKVLVIGMCLSIGIETLQFVFKKGFSEVDDVMHNTVGCLLGYGLFQCSRLAIKKVWSLQKKY